MSAQQLLNLVKNAQTAGSNLEPTHPRFGFARLCNDYTNLGGKPFKSSETIIEVQAWLRTCEMRSSLFSYESYRPSPSPVGL